MNPSPQPPPPPLPPTDPRDEDRLRTYGDALVSGSAPPPSDDLEATIRHVHRLLATPAGEAIPPDRSAAIWEDIMHQLTPAPALPASPTRTPAGHRDHSRSFANRARRREWGAMASVSLMLALVVALVGVLIALRAEPSGPADPTDPVNGLLAAQPTEIVVPDTCTLNPEYTSSLDLSTATLSDVPQPLYSPANPVTYEQGLAIQQAYLNYLRCSWTEPSDGTAVVWPDEDPNFRTFYSDRMQLLGTYRHAHPEQQAEIRAFVCRPIADELMATFPFTVNRPELFSKMGVEPNHQVARYIFLPSDVYQLPGGRFGVMIGSVSTETLRNPDVVTENDYLRFVAFVEQNGHYYIDEEIAVLTRSDAIIDPPPSDTPRTEITYHRYVDTTCTNGGTPAPDASATPAA